MSGRGIVAAPPELCLKRLTRPAATRWRHHRHQPGDAEAERTIRTVASTQSTVLILGERVADRQRKLVARAVHPAHHELDVRLSINCGGIQNAY